MSNSVPVMIPGQFEEGLLPFPNVDMARRDPAYVDSGVIRDEMSQQAPWTFSLLYGDGGALSIPLELMWFESLTGPRITVFRRHKASGRVIPCQILQNDPILRDSSLATLPWQDVLLRAVPPRFDPLLSPWIIAELNLSQTIYMALGVLNVIKLQLANPVLFGWSPAATAESTASAALLRSIARRSVVATADATALTGRLFGEVSSLPATSLQKFLEGARRLSLISGVSPEMKADAIQLLAKRLGLEIGGQSVMEGGRIVIAAKDGRTALQIAIDGAITFGRTQFVAKGIDILNPTTIRVFKF